MLSELLKMLSPTESRTKEVETVVEVKDNKKPTFTLGSKSKGKLIGVHPDLVAVVERAIEISTKQDFTVLEGLRTKERQRQLVRDGKSQTMNSRHLTGHAVDLAPVVNGSISWDWDYYWELERVMKQASKELGVPIEWGGDWTTFKDGPHWQLPWNRYK